jgi:high-affinity iron transporter
VLAFGLLGCAAPAAAQDMALSSPADRAGAVISLIELASSEYVDAVSDGRIINEAEYEEAHEFTEQALRRLAALPASAHPAGDARARQAAAQLLPAIDAKVDPGEFISLAEVVTDAVATGWDAIRIRFAENRPSARRGAVIYRINCAECHGDLGHGDGIEGKDLDPPPADLTAAERGREASLRRDFEVTSFGVPATAMEGWQDLLDLQERWDVVAYLQTLRFGAAEVAEGRTLALAPGAPVGGLVRSWSDPVEMAAWTDVELAGRVAELQRQGPEDSATRAIVAYLRAQTGEPFDGVPELNVDLEMAERFATIDLLLGSSLEAVAAGDRDAALSDVMSAYLQFEALEPALGARDRGVVVTVEKAFAHLRADLNSVSSTPDRAGVDSALAAAARVLAAERPSNLGLAVQSFVIILREGFEAILIIGAIIAFLIKTGRPEARRTVYAGVVGAVGASLAVAILLQALFEVAPARREVLEGATMLVAVAVLFSVSYWLVSKLQHGRWERYLKERMHVAIGAGGGLALGGVAFLAVFREGVETVLFYKALTAMAAGAVLPIVLGFVVGLAALVLIYLAFTRLGVRIPMRPFFALTSGILYLMATIFAGAGIAELQEAGVVGITPLRGLPMVPGLGVYPTVETVAAQGLMIALMLAALFITFGLPRLNKSTEVAGAPG